MIKHNLVYKLLALGVAIGLWMYVNAEQNPRARRSYTVPITITNIAKGYVAEAGEEEATITVSGLKSITDSIQRVSAVVDLDQSTPKSKIEKNIAVHANVFGVVSADLDDLSIVVNPQKVRVHIEALSGKRLPVEVKFPAAPPLGYSYSNPQLVPGSVSVSGKSTEVSQVKRIVLTLPNKMSDRAIDDYFELSALDSSGNSVGGVKLSPEKVRLKLELVEVPATKMVIVSPNITGEPKFPSKINKVSVSPSSVTLEGRPTALVGISTITTDRISIENESETVTKEVDLRVPPSVKVSGRSSVKVTIYIGAHE
jgi:YbbR domain-containing protein